MKLDCLVPLTNFKRDIIFVDPISGVQRPARQTDISDKCKDGLACKACSVSEFCLWTDGQVQIPSIDRCRT